MTSPDKKQLCRWHGFGSTEELAQAAARDILLTAQRAIDAHGAFSIVLAGGTSPRHVYEFLRSADAEWNAWHVYMGDERCLPPDNAERNSRMAAMAWLNHVPIPSGQIHLIPSELGAEIAAVRYTETVRNIEQFDLVLLGLGEDGHTASLFPGHEWGTAPGSPAAIAVHDSPKPPPERVSLSAHRLSMARQVFFLVTGTSKRQAIRDWQNGMSIPASAITPANGVDVYIEAALLQE